MGYPYDKTYLEEIQENKRNCKEIRNLFWNLVQKYKRDNNLPDEDLTLEQYFKLLAEAFVLEATALEGITDPHHFMWDVVDSLLGEEVLE